MCGGVSAREIPELNGAQQVFHDFLQAALPSLGTGRPADDTDVERSATLVAVKATGVAVAFARYVDISQAYPKPHTC